MTKKDTQILIAAKAALLVLILSWPVVPALAEAAPGGSVFAIPRVEAELVVTSWFDRQGYSVSKTCLDNECLLQVMRRDLQWRILLKHHSPLATEILLEKAPAGDEGSGLWKQLIAFLGGYTAQQWMKVPDPVLARKTSVVCITAKVHGREVQISGFVVDREGLILCTAHTLDNAQALTVYLADGTRLPGRIIREDDRRDLALIDCSHQFKEAVDIPRETNPPEEGKQVYAVGYPGNRRMQILPGVINGTPRLVENLPLLQVRMEVDPGSSGSPVFDCRGNLAAVIKGRIKGDSLSGLLIPLETIYSFLKDM